MDERNVAVVVMGGGPAGASAACFLARRGHEVLVLEREQFPRFHIGESLIPMALPVLDELGLDLKTEGHQFKAGATFRDESTGQRETYLFKDGLPGHPDHAYQVERATFDHSLLRLAERAGAEIHHGEPVQTVKPSADSIEVATDGSKYRARYLVDATGQRALLARLNRTVEPIREFGRAAAFAHYHELTAGAWDEIEPEGNIEILRVDHGWLWAIPLAGRRLSVGLVRDEGPMRPGLLNDAVAASPLLRRLTRGAQSAPPTLVGDYSYVNRRSHGSRFCCIGDAACFLDPVFSSGVTLALQGAARMARLLDAALIARCEHEPGLMDPLQQHMRPAYEGFFALIRRFYHTGLLDNLFFATDPEPEFRAGLITMLAGDVWRTDNALQNMVTKAERHAVRMFSPARP